MVLLCTVEVSKAVGSPQGTVRSQLHRGTAKLRHSLRRAGYALSVGGLVAAFKVIPAEAAPVGLAAKVAGLAGTAATGAAATGGGVAAGASAKGTAVATGGVAAGLAGAGPWRLFTGCAVVRAPPARPSASPIRVGAGLDRRG